MFFNLILSHFYKIDSSSTEHDVDLKNDKLKMISTCLNLSPCSELVDYTRSYLKNDKFGLHFGLDCNLW